MTTAAVKYFLTFIFVQILINQQILNVKCTSADEVEQNPCLFNKEELEKYTDCVISHASTKTKTFIDKLISSLGGMKPSEILRLLCKNSNDDHTLIYEEIREEIGDEEYEYGLKVDRLCSEQITSQT